MPYNRVCIHQDSRSLDMTFNTHTRHGQKCVCKCHTTMCVHTDTHTYARTILAVNVCHTTMCESVCKWRGLAKPAVVGLELSRIAKSRVVQVALLFCLVRPSRPVWPSNTGRQVLESREPGRNRQTQAPLQLLPAADPSTPLPPVRTHHLA